MRSYLKFLTVLILIIPFAGQAQQKSWVVFTDKKNVAFNPLEYFDPLAIERRLRAGVPLLDSSDFPLNPDYVAMVNGLADSVGYSSRWFNMLSVWAEPSQLAAIGALPFVQEIIPQTRSLQVAEAGGQGTGTSAPALVKQTRRFHPAPFLERGLTGKGIRVAVLDAGFSEVDVHPAFEHIRNDKRIIKTWDFVKNKEFVYGHSSHGRMVLACIGGIKGDTLLGLAQQAEFLLARTEYSNKEPFSEEEFWLAAAEWADKNGAMIINSSLGYTKDRYFPWRMDGRTSFVARAANLAARKGILVVNSAGNEGDSDWKVIGTPADADSVLAIGGIHPQTDLKISYSSYGPTSDRRLKPNVTAISHVLVPGTTDYTMADGTSFSGPLVAGFAACAWQAKPTLTNMELFREIEKSGDLYPYYDYVHGYGVPQAAWFTSPSAKNMEHSFAFQETTDSVYVQVSVLPDSKSQPGPGEIDPVADEKHYLFYHLQNPRGFLDKYAVLTVDQPRVIGFSKEELGNRILRVSYMGNTREFKP